MVGDHAAILTRPATPPRPPTGRPLTLPRVRARAAPGPTRNRRMVDLGHAHRVAAAAASKERILALAAFLPDEQRALLQALLRDGVTPAAVAKLRTTTPRAIRRQASMLIARVSSPSFAIVVAHARVWPPRRQAVARLCIVDGISVRAAAIQLGLKLHTLRCELGQIRAIAEAMALAGQVPDLYALAAESVDLRRTA